MYFCEIFSTINYIDKYNLSEYTKKLIGDDYNLIHSIQKWLPFDNILENGIILLKNNQYVLLIKVHPINFNLKSSLEKESILNSYKNFLKSCNFNIQIIIHSQKSNLIEHLKKVSEREKMEEDNIKNIILEYKNQINKLNLKNKYNSKIFYILIKQEEISKNKDIIINELKEKFFRIKDSLEKCGNKVELINDSKVVLELINEYFR